MTAEIRLAPLDKTCYRAVSLTGVLRSEHRRARHEERGARGRARPGGLEVDAAVDLDLDRVAHERAQARDLIERCRDELLAAPAGVHGHAQRRPQVAADLRERLDRRRGRQRDAGLAAGLTDVLDGEVDV